MSNIDRYVKFISEQKFESKSTDSTDTPSDDAFDQLQAAGALHLRTVSDGITYKHKGQGYILPHQFHPNGHRYVYSKALKYHLDRLKRSWRK